MRKDTRIQSLVLSSRDPDSQFLVSLRGTGVHRVTPILKLHMRLICKTESQLFGFLSPSELCLFWCTGCLYNPRWSLCGVKRPQLSPEAWLVRAVTESEEPPPFHDRLLVSIEPAKYSHIRFLLFPPPLLCPSFSFLALTLKFILNPSS